MARWLPPPAADGRRWLRVVVEANFERSLEGLVPGVGGLLVPFDLLYSL